uniref:Fatty acid hydroxylase domain-containing protein n=1 Tax=Chromera velia CCMP2878 TaxID=1169474 RepID=A0A0G4H8F7_9ALVE|eukprot:Cvel_867.t1-p1 / transcript=Cvel_867.t1 / gene=Cvel_867 / organism=Chromera_velia_CCMP2878 / gene_product=hypothetical protein / transcript_product=hypothetical protein / location=Cvel_scaffold27:65105-66975(+) / protein_length=506 / sequence_SO=supercontig / SO=protein_coding / is_pseudo=false
MRSEALRGKGRIETLFSSSLAAFVGWVAEDIWEGLTEAVWLLGSNVLANLLLFRCYFFVCLKSFRTLPPELVDEGKLNARLLEQKEFELNVPKSFVQSVDSALDNVEADIGTLRRQNKRGEGREENKVVGQRPEKQNFKGKMFAFFTIRLLSIAASVWGSLWQSFFISMLQFVFLPYSLFAAVIYGLETGAVLFAAYAVVFPLLTVGTDVILKLCIPGWTSELVSIPLSWYLILGFLLLDQFQCFVSLFWTFKAGGKPRRVSVRRTLESVGYGFLNCKTYFLVLLPLLCGRVRVNLLVWCLDAVLGISWSAYTRLMGFWNIIYYPEHRMGHLRYVYPDAHKFHHILHDATPFDAHAFGSGAPEEWLLLWVEVAVALCLSVPPPCLSWGLMKISWQNKAGQHTRAEGGGAIMNCVNFHCDHHRLHNRNFGISMPLEMVMGTSSLSGSDSAHAVWGRIPGFRLVRDEVQREKEKETGQEGGQHERETVIRLRFIPVEGEERGKGFLTG